MKTKFFFTLTLFCLLASSSVIGQEISKRTLQKIQRFEAMGKSTADIVQVLPGEKIIEKTALDNKTTLFCTDKSGKRTKIYEGKYAGQFSHSKTGERLCFQDEYEFIVKDISTLQEFRFPTVDPVYLSSSANISPDGNEILFNKDERSPTGNYSANDYLIVTKNLVSKEEQVIGKGSSPKWSPNSNQIVIGRADGYIDNWTLYLWILNTDGTGLIKLRSAIHLSAAAINWSSDGKYLMGSASYGDIRIVDVIKDEAVVVPMSRFGKASNNARKEPTNLSWSPDGKSILAEIKTYNFRDETLDKELFLISVDGTKIEKLIIPTLNNEEFRLNPKFFPIWLNSNELLFQNTQQGNIWNKTMVRSAESGVVNITVLPE